MSQSDFCIRGVVSQHAIAVSGDDGQFVVGVRPDGTVDIGDGVTLDEASRIFWEKVGTYIKAWIGIGVVGPPSPDLTESAR